jgi:hypothetical protein
MRKGVALGLDSPGLIHRGNAHICAGIMAAARGEWAEANQHQLRALSNAEDPHAGFGPRCWVSISLHMLGDPQAARAMLHTATSLTSLDFTVSDRALYALACEVLGVEGPPAPQGAHCATRVRIARRATERS